MAAQNKMKRKKTIPFSDWPQRISDGGVGSLGTREACLYLFHFARLGSGRPRILRLAGCAFKI